MAELKDRFLAARKALGMTQKQVSKILAVSQPQVSDYEQFGTGLTELQVLDLERRALERKEEIRKIERQLSRRQTGLATSAGVTLFSDDDLMQHVRKFVAEWETWKKVPGIDARDDCHIFLFGPTDDDLPVFEDRGIQELWSENLSRGVNYHLFWQLDGSTPKELADAYTTLTRVVIRAEEEVEENTSCVHVHGILLRSTNASPEADQIEASYQSLLRVNQKRLKIKPLINMAQSKYEEFRRWLRILRLVGAGPIILGQAEFNEIPHQPLSVVPPESFAARRLQDVSLTPGGPRATGWLFLSTAATREIVQEVEIIRNLSGG
jgi:transcriptional regulator with XRE-family HTH domain